MDESRETADGTPETSVAEAWQQVGASFERFCLTAGLSALGRDDGAGRDRVVRPTLRPQGRQGRSPLGQDAGAHRLSRRHRVAGPAAGVGARWEGIGASRLGGGAVRAPLSRWALNLMLINVSTRRFGRAVRLPEGDVPASAGSGTSKSAVSRRFVALSAAQMIRSGWRPTCRSWTCW